MKRLLIPIVLLAALGTYAQTAPATAVPAHRSQADGRPNILFVMTDDQTVREMRVMTKLRASVVDQGTTFVHNIATYPLCCPSRATFLTGQYSHNHGVIHNAGPFGGYARLDHTNTLPVWLQRAGYLTIDVGRYLNGYGTQNTDITEIPPGWTDWISTIDPSTFNFRSWRMNENGVILDKPGPDRPSEYQTDYLGRRASEEIERAAPSPQPFFLSLTFPAPHSGSPADPDDPPTLRTTSPAPRYRDAFAHTPLPRPPNFDEANVYDKPQIVADRPRLSRTAIAAIRENYQQELESLLSVDDAVGNVLDTLRRTGELDNTLVIYTSDNGFFHGEHRIKSEKILPYEEGLRVPLVMRGPGVPKGRQMRQLVGNIDLAPTILDAAHATPGRVEDGRSLFQLLRDRTLEFGRELVVENGRGVNSVPQFRGLRNNRYLYVRHDTTGEQELYDLRKDPYELLNLEDSDHYAGIRTRLHARLRRLQHCAGQACFGGGPTVRLALRQLRPKPRKKRKARRNQSCVAHDVRLSLFGRDGQRVESVRYYVGGRSLGSARRRPFFRVVVKRRRLALGHALRLRARVTTVDGRVVTLDRTIKTCPKV